MAIHTATGEASRVYSISENRMADGCFLRGGAASCLVPVAGASQLAPVNWRVRHATGTSRF